METAVQDEPMADNREEDQQSKEQQAPIIIGPDTVTQHQAKKMSKVRSEEQKTRPKNKKRRQVVRLSDSDDYDDEDTISCDDDFATGQLGQFMGAEEGYDDFGEYLTWDLLLKNIYKVPPLEGFLQRHEIRHEKFYENNKWMYNMPFLIFYQEPN